MPYTREQRLAAKAAYREKHRERTRGQTARLRLPLTAEGRNANDLWSINEPVSGKT